MKMQFQPFLYTVLAGMFLVLPVSAQNPFENIGKEVEVLTLSEGKFKEFHPNDSLRRVGSVVVNVRTKQVYQFIEQDTLYSEATLDPTIVSRWLSLDPLMAKYPNLSPYAFAGNSPIAYKDSDGRDIVGTINAEGKLELTLTVYTTEEFTQTERETVQAIMSDYWGQAVGQTVTMTINGETKVVEVASVTVNVNPATNEQAAEVYYSEGKNLLMKVPGRVIANFSGESTEASTTDFYDQAGEKTKTVSVFKRETFADRISQYSGADETKRKEIYNIVADESLHLGGGTHPLDWSKLTDEEKTKYEGPGFYYDAMKEQYGAGEMQKSFNSDFYKKLDQKDLQHVVDSKEFQCTNCNQ